MAAFIELDWRRLDVIAIVGSGGLTVIHERQRHLCHVWLRENNYRTETLDCRPGLAEAVPALGRMLNWEEQFGYALTLHNKSLDALQDAFDFAVPADGGTALEILGADIAWKEDPMWLMGLLSIAREHSYWHLALGERFFTWLVLPDGSPMIGAVIEKVRVPSFQHWPKNWQTNFWT